MKLGKRGYTIAFESVAWWVIGLIVLVLVVIGYFVLSGKAGGALSFFKNLLKFRM